MSWKDKDGNELNHADTVIVEGKISGRHSGDQISVEFAPGRQVLIEAFTCSKATAPKPKPKPRKAKKEK
ncbi:hypothetical protein LCGC14_1374670 [marine sediment metagenome]|uniref:Uncharacterized protein n=1 Tax=marine sediment metagenome TaxID=412755 RepID=A0A0F9KQF0_9ZZZZ